MSQTTVSLEKEKRFLLLLSSFFLGSNASKKEVLDFIEHRGYIKLTPEDRKIKDNRNEVVWRNDLAYVRKHLEIDGLFTSGIRNDWSITEAGETYLFTLYQQIKQCTLFSKITEKALVDARELFHVDEVELIMPYCEGFSEGRIAYRKHIVRERSRGLILNAKSKFKKDHNGALFCEVCGFDFKAVFGVIGEDFIEAHHTRPISQMQDDEKTKIEDIAMLCSNCHSMIHRKKPWASVKELKAIYKAQKINR